MHNSETRPPLISVIAVSYNQERWVLETLESIKAQTLQDFELIYADDASQDRSAEVATQWLRVQSFPIRSIIHRENHGLCRTLNEALRLCRGEYVQFIACDDVLLPQKFERHTALMDGLPEDTAVVYSDVYLMDAHSDPCPGTYWDSIKKWFFAFPEGRVFDQLLVCNFVPALSTFIRRSVYREIGNYDESLFYEDWDMWLRIAERKQFAFSPVISATKRRISSSMVFSQEKNVVFSQMQILDKWLRCGRLSRENREVAVQKLVHTARKLYALDHPRSLEALRAANSVCARRYLRFATLAATVGISHRSFRRFCWMYRAIKSAATWCRRPV